MLEDLSVVSLNEFALCPPCVLLSFVLFPSTKMLIT